MKREDGLSPLNPLPPFVRFGFSLVLILVAFFLAGVLSEPFPSRLAGLSTSLTDLLWFDLFLLPFLILIYKLLTRFLEHKPLASVGLAFHEHWLGEFGQGMALGGSTVLLTAGLERLVGVATFRLNPIRNIAGAAPLFLALFLAAAATEELLFRGYPFQRLIESITPAGAVTVTSILFGLIHMANPSHDWISTVNTMLIGSALAIAYIRTRALWLPLGIHFAWNYAEGYLCGLPVSGIAIPRSLLGSSVRGAAWLSGGQYGPEGSALTTVIVIALTLYLSFSQTLRPSKTMLALTLPSNEVSLQ